MMNELNKVYYMYLVDCVCTPVTMTPPPPPPLTHRASRYEKRNQ